MFASICVCLYFCIHVCAEYVTPVNPCKVASDYKPEKYVEDGVTCETGIAMVFMGADEANAATCAEEVDWDGAMKSRKAILAEKPQCCDDKGSKCDDNNNDSNKSSGADGSAGAAAVLVAAVAAAAAW